RAERLADELLEPAEHGLHAPAHRRARDGRVEGGARREAPTLGRAACHVHNDQIEETPEPGRRVALGQRMARRFQELLRVLVESAQEDRLLVTVSVVEAAAQNARRGGQVLHSRVVEALPPEHVQRDRDHLLLVELPYASHRLHLDLFLTSSSSLTY